MKDLVIRVSTRPGWGKFVVGEIDSDNVTEKMVELGAREFIRYRGTLTVTVSVEDEAATRRMIWRGIEEVSILPSADNPSYVSGSTHPVIHG